MVNTTQDHQLSHTVLPKWFQQKLPNVQKIKKMQSMFRGRSLSTVCESARCPNMGQCWDRGVATFMILGDICTRACRFCAVVSGRPSAPSACEPSHVAEMVDALDLNYVVITSVTRDDLPDGGAGQFVRTIQALRQKRPGIKIEVLIPDFFGRRDFVETVLDSGPDVLAHNVEMVERLFPTLRPQADYQRSLGVLRTAKAAGKGILVKSGFMVGLGETEEEIERLMADMSQTGCDMLTIGQYLAPSRDGRHVPVDRFVSPSVFEMYRQKALKLDFRHVFSGPLVRSSYIAEEGYRACQDVRKGEV